MLQFPAEAETVTPGNTFFRHMKRGACATGPETEEHLELKRIVVESARRRGWTAEQMRFGFRPKQTACGRARGVSPDELISR